MLAGELELGSGFEGFGAASSCGEDFVDSVLRGNFVDFLGDAVVGGLAGGRG